MRAFLSILILVCAAGCSTTSSSATRSSTETAAAIPSLKSAERFYHEGQLDSAELALRAILHADPKNQEAWYYLSLVYRSEAEVASRQLKPSEYNQMIPQQPIY
jgi:Tfp pilus assembly protein PilF